MLIIEAQALELFAFLAASVENGCQYVLRLHVRLADGRVPQHELVEEGLLRHKGCRGLDEQCVHGVLPINILFTKRSPLEYTFALILDYLP